MRLFKPMAAPLLLALVPAMVVAADASSTEIPALIEQLDDVEFARREAAAAELAKRGKVTIAPLVKAAQSTSPEVASRSVRLLEKLMHSDDAGVIDAADAALESLTTSDDAQASSLATAALARNAGVRELRAVARIVALGGQVQVGHQVDLNGQPLPGLTEEAARQLRPRTLLIGHNWKGGVEGLVHFHKLAHLSYLTIYVEKGCGVPLEQVQSLASILPGLIVHHRGPYLGVGAAQPDGLGRCVISEVRENGPAAKAGLQKGDVVLALEDQPVLQFHDLVDALKAHDFGDTVTLTIRRVNETSREVETIEVDVDLEPWSLPPVANNVQTR